MRSLFHHQPFRLLSGKEIVEQPLPPIPWIVENFMSEGERVLVYGEWGSYKTWFLMSLAIHLASGVSFLEKFPIHRPHNVLYFDEEMSEITLRRRIKWLVEGMGNLDLKNRLRFVNRTGTRFVNKEGTRQVLKKIHECGFEPDIIILDTFRRFMKGDEKEAKDVGEFWNNTTPLIEDGRTLVISHHMKKQNYRTPESSRDRASGSTDIMAGVDSAFSLTRKKEGQIITVRHEKARSSEEGGSFAFWLDSAGNGEPVKLELVGSDTSFSKSTSPKETIMTQFEDWLRGKSGQTVKTCDVISWFLERGESQRSAERRWETYYKTHRLKSSKRGYYDIPPKPAA